MAKADEDWYQRYQRREEEGRQFAEKLVAYVLPVLRFLGAEKVEIKYDGYGDEGQVLPPVLTPAPPMGLPEGLSESLVTICEELLPGGWEINAGSQGSFTIDVAAGTHHLDHEWNEEDEEDEYEEDLE